MHIILFHYSLLHEKPYCLYMNRLYSESRKLDWPSRIPPFPLSTGVLSFLLEAPAVEEADFQCGWWLRKEGTENRTIKACLVKCQSQTPRLWNSLVYIDCGKIQLCPTSSFPHQAYKKFRVKLRKHFQALTWPEKAQGKGGGEECRRPQRYPHCITVPRKT